MIGLFRRGGVWWARLVVPARLRVVAGRREFVRSTRCHDLALAKIIGATLLTTWRRILLDLGGHMDNGDLRRLLDGSPALVAAEFTTLARAGALTGLALSDLLGEAAAGRLALYCRVPSASRHGWMAARTVLERDEPGRWAVPNRPADSMPMDMGGHVLRLLDGGGDIADAALADGDAVTALVVLEHGPESIWVPDVTIKPEVVALEVLASQVEAVRRRWAAGVTPAQIAALERSETARAAVAPAAEGVGGPWASKRFSEAVAEYCGNTGRKDGLLENLKSGKEPRQRQTTMLSLVELHGDKTLGEITTDDLRAFRDWLRTWPANANNLGKELRRPTMMETIAAVAVVKPDHPKMSEGMVQDRMAWLVRLFRWLKVKKYLSEDVALDLKDDGDGLSKTEREEIKAKREAAAGDDDEEGRVPFDAVALTALFGLPQFKTGHGRHAKGAARCYPNEYWLRLLCLWHGLRLSEGAQLWLSDVREVEGVMVLDINRNTPDKSLKNAQSKRLVPLHPELKRLGFLEWCDRLREAGYRRVFPELTWRDADERYRREPGRKMTENLRALGYPRDSSLTFHSLRSTFNNALARVKSSALPFDMDEGMRTFLRYTLMGHAIEVSDTNKKNYSHITKKEYAAIVAAIEFEGMPEVVPFDVDWGLESVRSALSYHSRKPEVRGVEDCGPAT